MPVNNATTQSGDIIETTSSNTTEPSAGITWNETIFGHRPPRRTRSLQDLNAQISVSEAAQSSEQGEMIDQTHGSPLETPRHPTSTGHGGINTNTVNTTAPISSNNTAANASFEHYHRSANYDVYYEEKTPRPMLPFWQTFSHFEEKSTVPGQGYIGSYYGLENGRVSHGNSQGHHMYSPERVSAVAAAAAAAAAMVAMTPPINGAYQQSCYPPQGRPGSLCHPLPNQHSDHFSYPTPDEFNSPMVYQNRFPIERGRGDDFCGSSGSGSGGTTMNSAGWGAYRYPYMMRGLPLHPGDPMETEFPLSGAPRHAKTSSAMVSKVVDESLYSRPVAHVWRSQLHQLSISHLRPEDFDEIKGFHQIDCGNKIDCSNEVKHGSTERRGKPRW